MAVILTKLCVHCRFFESPQCSYVIINITIVFFYLFQPLRLVEFSAFLEQQRMDPESVSGIFGVFLFYVQYNVIHNYSFVTHIIMHSGNW